MTLDQITVGQLGRITQLPADNRTFRKKLIAMGVIPGTQLRLLRTAPLGDPMQFCVGDLSLSMRKADAAQIKVEGIA